MSTNWIQTYPNTLINISGSFWSLKFNLNLTLRRTVCVAVLTLKTIYFWLKTIFISCNDCISCIYFWQRVHFSLQILKNKLLSLQRCLYNEGKFKGTTSIASIFKQQPRKCCFVKYNKCITGPLVLLLEHFKLTEDLFLHKVSQKM